MTKNRAFTPFYARGKKRVSFFLQRPSVGAQVSAPVGAPVGAHPVGAQVGVPVGAPVGTLSWSPRWCPSWCPSLPREHCKVWVIVVTGRRKVKSQTHGYKY